MKDQIGFMKEVKTEVEELFTFIKHFEEVTGTRLVLTLFVDDLDRCLDGRCVKVLEAIQLILSIPGSPVIVFLAVDARIVVSSIEASFNRSLNPDNFEVSGWEYLDKIVQLPFALPLPPPVKVKRFTASAAEEKEDLKYSAVLKKVQDLVFAAEDLEDTDDIVFELPEEGESVSTNRSIMEIRSLEGLLNEYGNDPRACVIKIAVMMTKETKRIADLELFLPPEEFEEELCRNLNFVLYGMKIKMLDKRQMHQFGSVDFDFGPSNLLPMCGFLDFMGPVKAPAGVHGITTEAENAGSNGVFDRRILDEWLDLAASPIMATVNEQAPHAFEVATSFYQQLPPLPSVPQLPQVPSLIAPEDALLSLSALFGIGPSRVNKYLDFSPEYAIKLPRIAPYLVSVLKTISNHLEPNPRKLKRIVNVLLFVFELAACKPIAEDKPNEMLSSLPGWPRFAALLVKWLCLCECFPYRVSMLLQLLEDLDQKQDYNAISALRKVELTEQKERMKPIDLKYGSKRFGVSPTLDEAMFMRDFFHLHVDASLYVISASKHLQRLDGDPEKFAILLNTYVDTGSGTGSDRFADIHLDDILGPKNKSGSRDPNYSLLAYSFNLSPALRQGISVEVRHLSWFMNVASHHFTLR